MANGRRIRCTVEAYSNGPMASSIKGTFSMIRDKARASSNGKMDEFTMANG